jgi:hypothetical protein
MMSAGKMFGTGFRILAVCLLFAVCFAIGGALAGVARIAQEAPPVKATPAQLVLPFVTLCLCVGIVVSYLILRSSWHGFALVMAVFFAMYGISTVAAQGDSVFFLSAKLPQGMLPALFLQGLIADALFAALAVLILGKWRVPSPADTWPAPAHLAASSLIWRIALLVVAFVFLYMFFGYYIAWQNPDLREYYGGSSFPSFYDSLKSNWGQRPFLYLLQAFRALLFIACVFPLIRMLRVSRWERTAAIALFLSAWTTILLFPNPLMPMSVARSHFWETLAFSLTFGTLLGWLLGNADPVGQIASPA